MTDRIAVFVPSMRGGGAERVMLNLAGAFARRGLDVDLVLAEAAGPYLDQVPPRVRVVDLSAGRVIASLPPLVRYLRRYRPTAMLSAMEHANVVALWARRLARVPTRVVVSIRTTVSRKARSGQPLRGRLATACAGRFYPSADGVVAVSDGVADDFAKMTGFPRSCIRTIYNPVISELSSLSEAPVNDQWFAAGEPPVILGVGRLVTAKDFPTLLHAFSHVRSWRPARLLILGEGDKRAEIEGLAQKLGLACDVRLPGYVDNPFAYMRRCSVFVLSSAHEGLPNSLIEAMACGAPVVSTDCPSGPAEILDGGRYGRLVPVGDTNAMAAAILTILQDAPDTTRTRQRAEIFSIEAITDQYLSLLLGGCPSDQGRRAA